MGKRVSLYHLTKKLIKKFLRLSIAKKLLLGYLPLIALTLVTASFALVSLTKLIDINRDIIENDIPLIKSTDKMVNCIFAQELYGNRYVLLKSSKMRELFNEKRDEFNLEILKCSNILKKIGQNTKLLDTVHIKYLNLFYDWFENNEKEDFNSVEHNTKISTIQKELIEHINNLRVKAGLNQLNKTVTTTNIGENAFRITAILCILSLLIGISAAAIITRNISSGIKTIKSATIEISNGNFENFPKIKNQDELGDLSESFQEMAVRLKKLEKMNLDANPLTYMPGGNTIEVRLKKRIEQGNDFALCVIDLDNFKVFNDKYGYSRGNKAIIKTSEIIQQAIIKNINKDNFIGHIGGDDFIIITTVTLFQKICEYVVNQFDKGVEEFYDEKDLKRGYIEGKNRQGVEKKFPIMTISIAVITNQKKKSMHYLDFVEKAAELKEYVKSIPGSLYCVDRRRRKK